MANNTSFEKPEETGDLKDSTVLNNVSHAFNEAYDFTRNHPVVTSHSIAATGLTIDRSPSRLDVTELNLSGLHEGWQVTLTQRSLNRFRPFQPTMVDFQRKGLPHVDASLKPHPDQTTESATPAHSLLEAIKKEDWRPDTFSMPIFLGLLGSGAVALCRKDERAFGAFFVIYGGINELQEMRKYHPRLVNELSDKYFK
jgi:hypothetical protein